MESAQSPAQWSDPPAPPVVAIHATVTPPPPPSGVYPTGSPITFAFHAVRLPDGLEYAVTNATASDGVPLPPVSGQPGTYTYTPPPSTGGKTRTVVVTAQSTARIGCGASVAVTVAVP